MPHFRVWLFGITSVATLLRAGTESPEPKLEPIAPVNGPFAVPQFSRPEFPQRIFDVRDFGAIAGGDVKNTEAFARAIAAGAKAGGGRVLVPAGRWFTGPIHLRSNIELHLDAGAEIVFSDRFEDYLPVVLVRVGGIELYNYSPLIYARDCVNVAITGPGRLNGNAAAWWAWKGRETKRGVELARKGVPVERRIFGTPEAAIRPNFVVFFNCRNVLLEGFTIGGGPNWTIHPVYSENVIIRRVHVLTDGPNNDGIDPDSCRNVLVEHCVFDTGDDCVVLKSGYNEDGWRVARPTENVVMRWCSARKGHGGLVIGSEMSGDVRNVWVHDCDFTGTDRAVRIKSRADRGGIVENVWAENLQAADLQREVVILNMDYGSDRNQVVTARPPVFRRMHFKNIRARGAPVAIRIQGLANSMVSELTFEKLDITSHQGVLATNVRELTFADTVVNPATGPAYVLTNARDVAIRGAVGHAGKGAPFLHVAGDKSGGIRIERAAADEPLAIERGPDVGAEAVSVLTPVER